MILKELDAFLGGPAHALAARIAADRMAYYLRRYYRHSMQVDVLNGLRVRSGGSMSRVDHLLLHDHGMLIIEREELTGRVQIDDEGQWMALDGRNTVMLDSPITRAYVQALLLKAFLDRRVRIKGFFDHLELDVLVVVSDECEIVWPRSGPLAEVCHRDEVYAKVSARLEQCDTSATRAGPLNSGERQILGRFLQRSHWPGTGTGAGAGSG